MNDSIYRVSLDVQKSYCQSTLNIKKNDNKRRFIFTLVDGGYPYKLEGCTAVFRAKKPDGTVLYNNCTISNNVATYKLTNQTSAVVGIVECELTIYGSTGEQLTSPKFNLVVEETLYDDSEIESENEFTALSTAISGANNLNVNMTPTEDGTTIIVTKKDGTKQTANISNGIDGDDGVSVTGVEVNSTGNLIVALSDGSSVDAGVVKGDKGDPGESYDDTPLKERLTVLEEGKVDKVSGKGLSTNDYTDAEADKVYEAWTMSKQANKAVSFESYISLINILNVTEKEEYSVGQSIYIQTLNVPDLWVYGIETTSQFYTYTTDEAFIEELNTNGYVKVGYYKLAALETKEEKLIADEPKTIGQKNCLARAAHFRDIKVTPTGSLPLVGAPATTTEFTGVPYSSVRDTDLFIGFAVSLDTYMTAIHNPNSVLYTNQSNQALAASWYGANCSSFVSYCYDLPYIRTTQTFAAASFMKKINNSSEIELCDCCNDNAETGHIVLITGIERNSLGTIKYVTISECYPAFTKQTRLTFEEFDSTYNNGKYIIYRNTRLEYVTQADASKWIGDGVVTRVDYEYSDLCTNLGDKACIATDDTIILQPLNTDGYTGITVLKDGEEYQTYSSVENVTLTNLPAGMYEAKLTPDKGISSVSFEVLEVGTEKHGNRYTFTSGKPLAVVFKISTFYSVKYVELTNVDRRNGYKDIITTDIENVCAYFCVAYKGKYGIVVKRYNFEDTPVPSDIPDEYQKVEYIQSSGTEYIDTGVVGTNTTNCDVTAMYMEYVTGMANQNIFGVQNNGYRRWIGLSTKVGTGYGTNSAVDIGVEQASYRANKKCVFSIHDNVYSVTCESDSSLNAEHTYTAAEFTTEANCMLFASMLNGSTLRPAAARIYSAYIYDDTTLVREFVPCYRKEDGVIGMYDKVTETFYTNAGTGTFAKGSNV